MVSNNNEIDNFRSIFIEAAKEANVFTAKLYDVKRATEALSGSQTGFQKTIDTLAGSKALGVISRLASGILPTFWQLQNKVRAGFTIINEYHKKQTASTEEAMKAMEALLEVREMETAMKLFKKLYDKDFFNSLNDGATGLKKAKNMVETLRNSFKGFDGVEYLLFGEKGIDTKNLDDMKEVLNYTKEITERQFKQIEDRKEEAAGTLEKKRYMDNIITERQNKKPKKEGKITNWLSGRKGLQKYFDKQKEFSEFRKGVIEKQVLLFDFFTKIRKNFKGYLKSGWNFFKTAMKWFAIIVLTLFAIRKAFQLLKEPLIEAWVTIKEEINFVLGGIMNTISDLVGAFYLLYDGFVQGDFLMVVGGIILIGANILKLALQVLGGLVWLSFISVISILGEILESLLEGGATTVDTIAGIMISIGLVLGALTYLGIAIYSLPVILAWTLGGILVAAINPFSTGGVVNSNMQLVGERGAELVSLPRGSRVHSNADSKGMMGGSGGNTINVNVNGRVGASDTEIRDIANKVAREINLRMNRTGSVVNNF